MTFPRRLPAEGEDRVLDRRPHWIALVWPLVLESAGEFGQETFTNICRPEVVQKTSYEMNEANLRRIQAPSVSPSIADELAKLDHLRRRWRHQPRRVRGAESPSA